MFLGMYLKRNLDNLPSISEEQIAKICEYLITQHDSLRAQFSYKENNWIQEIKTPDQICALQYVDLSKTAIEEIENVVVEQTQTIQSQFNLSKGSLFKCIYFSNSATSKDFCVLISHHLVGYTEYHHVDMDRILPHFLNPQHYKKP